MGRPPLGKRAMTTTERQRRWRAKSRADKPTFKSAAAALGQLQTRVRELEVGQAALCATMEKLAQRSTARSKKARLVLDREFQAALARLRNTLASRPKTRLDKVLTVTGYHEHMLWLLDPDSNEVVGPLVPTRLKAPTGNRAKARRGRGSRADMH